MSGTMTRDEGVAGVAQQGRGGGQGSDQNPDQRSGQVPGQAPGQVPGQAADGGGKGEARLLFDLAGLDLSGVVADRAVIDRTNPHRDVMALLDEVRWVCDDRKRVVGVHRAKPDAFWVTGHFPERPMLPGVLMVEAGAQLCCFLWNIDRPQPQAAVFLRIEQAAFRRSVAPGDELFLLAQPAKMGRRRFITDVQGVLEPGGPRQRVAFEARVVGMAVDDLTADLPGG